MPDSVQIRVQSMYETAIKAMSQLRLGVGWSWRPIYMRVKRVVIRARTQTLKGINAD